MESDRQRIRDISKIQNKKIIVTNLAERDREKDIEGNEIDRKRKAF